VHDGVQAKHSTEGDSNFNETINQPVISLCAGASGHCHSVRGAPQLGRIRAMRRDEAVLQYREEGVLTMPPVPRLDLEVSVDVTSMNRFPEGGIFGIVYARMAGLSFPEATWSDLVVRVLVMWLESLRDLHDGSRRTVRLYFMDGPYYISVQAGKRGGWRAAFVDSDHVTCAGMVDAVSMTRSVLAAARAVAGQCYKNQWHSRDLVHLSQLEHKVRKMLDRA
jgi:hypothetical protein